VSKHLGSDQMGRSTKTSLIANLCLWIYFWISFAQASYPYRPNPLGHPAGTGYTFWGHSIAVVESGLAYPFFRVMFYVQFPSYAFAILVVRMFSPHLLLYGFFAGISKGGWLLLAVMIISFFQWYIVGGLSRRIWHRYFRRPRGFGSDL
jgi:hypothetical protein